MGGLFSTPKMPPVTPPKRMPVENDKAGLEAEQRKKAQMALAQGRTSTELTPGGKDGTGKVLGA